MTIASAYFRVVSMEATKLLTGVVLECPGPLFWRAREPATGLARGLAKRLVKELAKALTIGQ